MGRPLGGAWYSVRARTTAGAVVAVGIALLFASFALIVLVQRTMERNVASAARLRANDLVASLEAGQALPNLTNRDDDVFVQIVDEHGDVLAASPTLEGDPVVAHLAAGETVIVHRPPIGDDDPFVVAAEEARERGREPARAGRARPRPAVAGWEARRCRRAFLPAVPPTTSFSSASLPGRSPAARFAPSRT